MDLNKTKDSIKDGKGPSTPKQTKQDELAKEEKPDETLTAKRKLLAPLVDKAVKNARKRALLLLQRQQGAIVRKKRTLSRKKKESRGEARRPQTPRSPQQRKPRDRESSTSSSPSSTSFASILSGSLGRSSPPPIREPKTTNKSAEETKKRKRSSTSSSSSDSPPRKPAKKQKRSRKSSKKHKKRRALPTSSESDYSSDSSSASSAAATSKVAKRKKRDRKLKTIIHGFKLEERRDKKSRKEARERMRRLEHLPIEIYKPPESGDDERGHFVAWGNNFITIVRMYPGLTQKHGRVLLTHFGAYFLSNILGASFDVHGHSFTGMWNRIDRYYAMLGSVEKEKAALHKIQQGSDSFPIFLTKLRNQCVRAELSERERDEEIRTAVLERSRATTQLSYESKLKNLTLDDILRIAS